MKIINFVSALFFIIVSLSSCTKSCVCGRQCNSFNNGIIKICQTSYADSAQFAKISDSLSVLYGSPMGTFADSVSVGGSSPNAIDAISSQLEKQGYTCNCTY